MTAYIVLFNHVLNRGYLKPTNYKPGSHNHVKELVIFSVEKLTRQQRWINVLWRLIFYVERMAQCHRCCLLNSQPRINIESIWLFQYWQKINACNNNVLMLNQCCIPAGQQGSIHYLHRMHLNESSHRPTVYLFLEIRWKLFRLKDAFSFVQPATVQLNEVWHLELRPDYTIKMITITYHKNKLI